MFTLTSFISALLTVSASVIATCPPFEGSVFVEQEDLYPESADWDPIGCKLYISAQFNCTLAIFDPYTKTTEVVDLPGISHPSNVSSTVYHLNGIDYSPKSGNIFITASNALAFESIITPLPNGQIGVNYTNANYTGPNRIVIWDTKAHSILADISLDEAQEEFFQRTGNYTNGFQDMAEVEATGDPYVIGTFGNSLVRIPYGSKSAQLWYSPPEYSITYGFGGIVAVGPKLVISDTISQGFVTFDTTQDEPTANYVALQGLPDSYHPNADGLYAPAKYDDTILLWSDDYNGTSVYASNDTWETAHFIGLIKNDDPGLIEIIMTTDSFAIGDRVFVVTQVFQYSYPIQRKKIFLFYDITEELDGLIRSSFVAENS